MSLSLVKALVWVFACLAVALGSEKETQTEDFEYIHHDHPATLAILDKVHKKCPEITRVYNLSETSVQGRELVVIEMTEEPGKHITSKLLPFKFTLIILLIHELHVCYNHQELHLRTMNNYSTSATPTPLFCLF